ncbi:hypothetical protein [Cysteiniphilum sp. 19S12-1]
MLTAPALRNPPLHKGGISAISNAKGLCIMVKLIAVKENTSTWIL